MSLTDKNIREKKFHNNLQSRTQGRFENIFYKAIYNSNEDFFDFLKSKISGKKSKSQLFDFFSLLFYFKKSKIGKKKSKS